LFLHIVLQGQLFPDQTVQDTLVVGSIAAGRVVADSIVLAS
jgi:hypothetical protein